MQENSQTQGRGFSKAKSTPSFIPPETISSLHAKLSFQLAQPPQFGANTLFSKAIQKFPYPL